MYQCGGLKRVVQALGVQMPCCDPAEFAIQRSRKWNRSVRYGCKSARFWLAHESVHVHVPFLSVCPGNRNLNDGARTVNSGINAEEGWKRAQRRERDGENKKPELHDGKDHAVQGIDPAVQGITANGRSTTAS